MTTHLIDLVGNVTQHDGGADIQSHADAVEVDNVLVPIARTLVAATEVDTRRRIREARAMTSPVDRASWVVNGNH